jgi:hypothetical protein
LCGGNLRGLEIVTRTLELLFTFWCLLAYLASWALGHFASFMIRQLLALFYLEDVPLAVILALLRSVCQLLQGGFRCSLFLHLAGSCLSSSEAFHPSHIRTRLDITSVTRHGSQGGLFSHCL